MEELADLEIAGEIRRTTTCTVHEGKFRGEKVMIKVYPISGMDESEKNKIQAETIHNRYLVHYITSFLYEEKFYVVLEYFYGNTLEEYIRRLRIDSRFLTEATVLRALVNLLYGLNYLHSLHLIHRDIAPNNIMISLGGEFVLSDLGFIRKIDEEFNTKLTVIGNPLYRAPEILKQHYDYKVDIWSLGCVIYEMCTLEPPFRTNDLFIFQNDANISISRIPSYYSDEFNELIENMLQFDSTKRFDTTQLLNSNIVKRFIMDQGISGLPCSLDALIYDPMKEGTEYNEPYDPTNAIITAKKIIPKVDYSEEDEYDDDDEEVIVKEKEKEKQEVKKPKKPKEVNNNNNNNNNNPPPKVPVRRESDGVVLLPTSASGKEKEKEKTVVVEEEEVKKPKKPKKPKKVEKSPETTTSKKTVNKPIEPDLTSTIVMEVHDDNPSINKFYNNEIGTLPSHIFINTVLEDDSFEYFKYIADRMWWFPTNLKSTEYPLVPTLDKGEWTAFSFNTEMMNKFYKLLDKSLNYLGYKRQEKLLNYTSNYTECFQRWGNNHEEYTFIKRMLTCLNFLNLFHITEMIGIRLFFDTKDKKYRCYFPEGKSIFKHYWLLHMRQSKKYDGIKAELDKPE